PDTGSSRGRSSGRTSRARRAGRKSRRSVRAGRASPRGACASPYQIDRAVREFGFPMGPFQVVDLAGGDIGWATR
ncbi:hypothetical protein DN504_30950, partial [Burkholderia multivorans]